MLASDSPLRPITPVLPEVLIGLVAFGLLALVLMKVVFPRMERTFEARADAIDGGLARAEAARSEAERLRDSYRAKLAEGRAEAALIRERARAEAEQIRAEALAAARAEAEAIVAAGREQLAAERAAVHRGLLPDIDRLAAELADRIVHEPGPIHSAHRGH
ncbi:F-type H+-transporting ATPase subunit b [Asanoa hainanensis]|uniref:ATP synthase subunit b n=1 Tax=Asanoa hainanensis TaxID=560556 RepID=A0A239LF81_9ACTN|nr:F0F1 ATP synthase subunit B [Asanoa hainanensis]SNT28995.1 F-type H+-transporting ATPase subunit b [Asanoa hainanensis]